MGETGLFTSRGIGDLERDIISLGEQGFRIVGVIDTQNGDYHVIAQKYDLTELGNVISQAVYEGMRGYE